ncbi:complement C3 [Caerostris extrusa]|uniref:Complement C3 n=1 Tax=Caerostris extrusa TaxID=172846 RepID=A0AAV4V8Q9_CAEEX|nr:complement C3 [Caerostris extrusa]
MLSEKRSPKRTSFVTHCLLSIAMDTTVRCIGLLCFALFLSTASAQFFHVIAPNTFRLDSDETIAIAVEGKPSAMVNVVIQDHPGKIKKISETRLEVHAEQPSIFKVRLNPESFPPSFLTGNTEKFVLLTVSSDNFLKEIQIPVSNQAGYLFIQTDKPIYTPKENAHFRIIPLNENELPSDKPFKLQIKNPKNIIVEETLFNKKFQGFGKTFVSHTFKFPNFPVLGEWSATVKYGHEFEQNTTVYFELQKYVLPTFTVELKAPEVILETDQNIILTVKAKYVYGENVKGLVTYRLGVKGETPNVTFFAVVGPKKLKDGTHRQVVETKEFAHHRDIGWFPGIEGSHLVVEAAVVDDASGNKEVALDATGRFSKSPFTISFKRCLEDFKPGLVSIFEADINYIDGRPASGITTTIKALADGEPLEVKEPTHVSDEEGKVSFQFHPTMRHNTISVTLETSDARYVGNQAVGHFVQHRFKSDNNAFLALERSSTHQLKIGDNFQKILHIEPPAMRNIYYAVVSKGKIVSLNKLPEGDYKALKVSFRITHDMVPSFRLVTWAHYKDELVADSLQIDIEDSCNPGAKVTIEPQFELKEPGRAGVIHIKGTKDTMVGLLGVDEAVYALSKKDLLTKSKVFKTMAKHDLGCGPGGGLTTDDVFAKAGVLVATTKYSPKPGASSCIAVKRRKRAVANEILTQYTGLDKQCCALGLSHDQHNRNCEERTNVVTRYLQGNHENCSRAFLECCLYGKENGFTDMKLMRSGFNLARSGGVGGEDVQFISEEDKDFFEKQVTVRSDFRETWFFVDIPVGHYKHLLRATTDHEGQRILFFSYPDNKEEFAVSLPHSITTWVIQAVSVSPYHGICVAEPQKIVSFKKIFVQLNLPYSVVRNEQVEIQATVFNYGATRLGALVYMYGVKDLCTGANEGEKSESKRLYVDKQSAATVTFPVIPLKEGSFDVKVAALTSDGSDVILRKLNVVPEGAPVEVNIPIRLDPTNQQRREKRQITTPEYSDSIDPVQKLQITAINLAVPEEFVPGTESCTITALGDQFGPTVETAINNPDKLLEIPRGCGEQNMMFLAPTLYTMRYLKIKGKITPEIEEKGFSFIRLGYGNQLAFRKDDGSYAAYIHKPTSTWLTAFVAKVFCQANEIVYINEQVMCSAVKWLVDNQQPDGSFIEKSPVYHVDMMGQTPLTAFTLISLEECKCNIESLHLSRKRALAYLEDHLGDVNEPLAVAIMAYALSLSDSVLRQAAYDKMISIAKHNPDTNTMYWGAGDTAQDIETTSYALLTLLLNSDMERSNSVVNWLNSQRLQSGSFKSTQDTVVGLQALSEYAIRAQAPSMNLVANISSNNDRNFMQVLNFNEDNAHILKNIKVNKVGGMLFVNTAGHGIGSLSVKLRYNVVNPPEKICKFDVSVNVTEAKKDRSAAPKQEVGKVSSDLLPEDLIRGMENVLQEEDPVLDIDPRNRVKQRASLVANPLIPKRTKRQAGKDNSKVILKVSICARYLGNGTAGMSIIDVGIFSGFEASPEDLEELQNNPEHLIEQYETSSKGIVFYLKTVPKKRSTVSIFM